MEVFNTICLIITALATVALAIFAFQARNSYLRQELHSFAWEFIENYRDLRAWILRNIDKLDLKMNKYNEELDKELWNRLDIVEKLCLKIDFAAGDDFFCKTKEIIKMFHNIWLNYATHKDNLNKHDIQNELLNHVEINEFIRFVDRNRS